MRAMGKFIIEFEEEDGVLPEKDPPGGTETADPEGLAKNAGVSRIDAESCE